MQIELHQLLLKYAELRVLDPARDRRLLASLAEGGQQSPVVVIREREGSSRIGGVTVSPDTTPDLPNYILLDGYARLRALRSLGRDVIVALVLDLPESEALLVSERLDNARSRSALEDGWLLQLLIDEHGLSQRELSERLDRNPSWISRRLGLARTLPSVAQRAVREGRIPAQAAMKSLLPLARANTADCEALVGALGRGRLSVRDAARIYDAWRRGDPQVRVRLVAEPRLFLRADEEARRAAKERAAANAEVDREVEAFAELLKDLGAVAGISARVSRRLAEGAASPRTELEARALRRAWARARHAFGSLCARLTDDDLDERDADQHLNERDEATDAGPRHSDGDPQASRRRPRQADDRRGAQHLAQRGPPGAAERAVGSAEARAT